jgi:adenylate cyclase class IV
MAVHSYEIEIKCLLGGKEAADSLRAKLQERDANLKLLRTNKQLNHYFTGSGLHELLPVLGQRVAASEKKRFEEVVRAAKAYSLRTRWIEGEPGVRIVIKAAVDNTTSANGTARIEFDSIVPGIHSLDELDKLLLGAGFHYEAKWSREREEYQFLDAHVTIDKNAGYGYLAEFEIVATDASRAEETKKHLRAMMAGLGVEELDAARLERMFAYYNIHWPEYYGTEKIFIVQ